MRSLGSLHHRGTTLALIAIAAVTVVLPLVPGFNSSYRLTQLQLAGSLVIIVLGLNLLTGYGGQISLGHSGFVLIGAYVVGVLVSDGVFGYPLHAVFAVPAAMLITGAIGFGVGLPALRLSGPYLAIVTLGFALVVPVMLKWTPIAELSGGSQGLLIRQPRPPELFQWLTNAQWRYYVIALPALAAGIAIWNITRGRFGRALVAIRDHELAAEQSGVNVALHKTLAFAMSASCAGLGGGLFSYSSLGIVTPDSYGLFDSIDYVIAIAVGGVASIAGSVLGAFFIAFQKDLVGFLIAETWTVSLGSFELFSVSSPLRAAPRPEALRPAIYGVLLIISATLAPSGIAGLLRNAVRWRPLRAPQGSGARAPEHVRKRAARSRPRQLPDLRDRPHIQRR